MKKHTCIAEAHEVFNDLNIAALASDEQRRTALPEEDVDDNMIMMMMVAMRREMTKT